MAGPDFYTILRVSRTASLDEIKSAHRELVKKFHPDLFPGAKQKAQANKKLQQINEAYATLSNQERRRQYDSRYPPKVTVVNPARPAGQQSSSRSFRRPPAVPVRENLARRANEKLNQIGKTLSRLAKAAWNAYSDLSREIRTAKQAAASESASSSPQSRTATARAWNFVRRWIRQGSVKVTAAILGIMVLVLILRAVWEQPEISHRVVIVAEYGGRTATGQSWAKAERPELDSARLSPLQGAVRGESQAARRGGPARRQQGIFG